MVRRGFASLVLFLLMVLALPRVAQADQPGAHTVPVAVLAFDSDDAEEQADAITNAVRSRIRAAQGWSLIETTQALGMLTAAMKCPSRPTPECQQKIAEQIKAQRYVWGFVAKGPASREVTAEVHLYQKGKPDTVLKETYADNLKDANDDTLRKIASRIVERLGGTTVGAVVVRSPDPTGEVIIDGDKHVAFDKGTARIEIAAGSHSIEVAPTGGPPVKRNVVVVAGRETVVEITRPAPVEPPEVGKSKTRKIVGGVSMGVGAVLGGIAVYSLVNYLELQSEGEDRAAKVEKRSPPTPCKEYDTRCASIDKDSRMASGLALGLGGAAVVAIGFGAYMFLSAPSSTETNAVPAKARMRVVPTVGVGSGGVVVVGSF